MSRACASPKRARSGDFGLGCVDHLGGEVVIVDGEAIECTLDGPPLAMDDDDILRLRSCANFLRSRESAWASSTSRASAIFVEGALLSRNLFHALC
jgi:acetolactate decarboxylase